MLRLGLAPARLKAFVLNLGDGPDVEQARAFLSEVGLSMFLEEIEGRPDDLDVERTLRVLEDYKSLDVECAAMGLLLCPGHSRSLPGVALPRRRRRRRREPQGLPDRGEPRADHPQRRRQPDALPGRLGRRPDQALADLQRRPEPQLRADLRAGDAVRVRRLQPLHATERHRGRRGHSVRGADALRRADALLAEGRDRPARRQGGDRARHAGLPEAPLPARRHVGRRDARSASAAPSGTTATRSSACMGDAGLYPAAAVGARPLRPRAAGSAARCTIPGGTRGSSSRTSGLRTEAARGSPPCCSRGANARGAARCAICGATRPPPTRRSGRFRRRWRPRVRRCATQPVAVTGMKLYNAGSFFDPRAVPDADYDGVAAALDRTVARDRRVASRARRARASIGSSPRSIVIAARSRRRRSSRSRWGSRPRIRTRSIG